MAPADRRRATRSMDVNFLYIICEQALIAWNPLQIMSFRVGSYKNVEKITGAACKAWMVMGV